MPVAGMMRTGYCTAVKELSDERNEDTDTSLRTLKLVKYSSRQFQNPAGVHHLPAAVLREWYTPFWVHAP